MIQENTETMTDPAADAEAFASFTKVDAIDQLTQFYAQQENDNDVRDEPAPLADSSVEGETSAEETQSAEIDVAQTTGETIVERGDKPKTADAEISTEDELAGSNFDALEENSAETVPPKPDDYLDAEGFAKAFPRQQKAFYEKAADYSARAKRGDEVLFEIGGENAVAPAAKMSKGIREGDLQSFYEGVTELGDSAALVEITGQGAFLTGVKAKEWAEQTESPELAEIGKAMLEKHDSILSARYGDGINSSVIEQFADLKNLGWLEAINRWKEQEFVDSDEFYELLEADKAPKQFQTLREKQRATEAELVKTKSKLSDQESAKASDAEKQFQATGDAQIEKVFTETVWQTSVLKEIPSDTPELKETKAEFRNIILDTAKKEFMQSEDYKILAESYRRGDAKSDKFQRQLAKTLNKTILGLKEKNSIYERTVAQIYGKTRNAQLSKAKTAKVGDSSETGRAATETEKPADRPMTQDDIVEQMTRQIRALGV